TVGDPETILLREILYVSFIAISGFGALGFYQVYKRLKNRKFVAFLGYAGFITTVFAMMPQNPDVITAPMDLVNDFRTVSLVGVSAFWLSVGLILGVLWQKIQPDRVKQSKFQ
ncbi:MAG: CbtA domain containing protein, partial [Candidatus Nitrosotenuis sp.]|nr:CbtA domain containing protein [Candidatus Nitrosotenuis sp.]